MARLVALLLTLLAPMAWAGDEFLTPALRENSGFESTDPKYRVVGMEDRDGGHTLYVVADAADVLTQKGVNRIIQDIRRRNPGFLPLEREQDLLRRGREEALRRVGAGPAAVAMSCTS